MRFAGCRFLVLSWALFGMSAFAAPQLRLNTTTIAVTQLVGATSSPATIEADNVGDGSLSLTLAASPPVAWLTASVGVTKAAQNCLHYYNLTTSSCAILNFAFNTSSLPRGMYTAEVTVSDADAIDAPQVITVTVKVGGSESPLDVYLSPGKSLEVDTGQYTICGDTCGGYSATTNDGGSWLMIGLASYSVGDSWFTAHWITITASLEMTTGSYAGNVSITYPGDNHSVPVTMNVTTQPIAVPSLAQLTETLAQGGPPVTYPFQPYVSLSNSGMGALTVQDVSGSGSGVSAYNYNGLAIITLDPGSLDAGTYTDGVVTFQCNAANCPLQIPVTLKIVPRGPPVLNYQGAMANSGGSPGGTVAPGEVMIVQGQQLSNQPAVIASTFPLPTTLGGTSVWVNGSPAPLYYSSAGQIAFQMPSSAVPGSALVQVQRDDGQSSNFISVSVQPLAPQIVVVTDTNYNLVDSTHPIAAGGTLVIWAIGLGPTSPAVPDGAAAPASPLTQTVTTPAIRLSGSEFDQVGPTFCGLAPGEAGLYQVILKLPSTLTGNVLLTVAEPGSIPITSTSILVH